MKLVDRLYAAWEGRLLPLRPAGRAEVVLEGVGEGVLRSATARYTVIGSGGESAEELSTWIFIDGAWRLAPPPELPVTSR